MIVQLVKGSSVVIILKKKEYMDKINEILEDISQFKPQNNLLIEKQISRWLRVPVLHCFIS